MRLSSIPLKFDPLRCVVNTPDMSASQPKSDRKKSLDLLAFALLVACCCFWGYQQILIKATIAEVPPLWQASIRFAGATLLLVLWCFVRGIPLFTRDGTSKAGLLAGTLFTLQLAGVYLGIQYTAASRQTVFLYIAPFVVAIMLPHFIPEERLRRAQWVGLILAFSSVGLALSEGLMHSKPGQMRGDLMAVGSGLLWGMSILSIRTSALARVSAEKTMLYQVLVPALALPLGSLLWGETWSFHYSVAAGTSLLLQTLVGGFVSFLTWMWLLRHYPTTLVSSFSFLTPVFALFFGAGLLQEDVSLKLLIALAGVASGMLLMNKTLLTSSKILAKE